LTTRVGELEKNPPNPKGSIRARVISSNMDRAFKDEEELPVYWPLFPYDLMPVKEGEHVYVCFEDNASKGHGLWITRVPENFKSDQRNIVPGSKKYKDESTNDFSDVGLEQAVQGTDSPPKDIKVSDKEFTSEDVPPFTARVGDRIIEGSNNTLITLSRDRITDPESGEKENSGTVIIATGRKEKENLNFKDDKASFLIVTSSSKIDENWDLKSKGSDAGATAAIGLKSDEIRISAKKGMKIVIEDGDVYIDCKNINIKTSRRFQS
jgi:hypothetical protein